MEPFNAGDTKQVQKRESREKIRRLRRDSGFRKIMFDEESRAWMWDLLSVCGVFRISFDPSSAQTAFNEGMRNIGLRLLADINRLCPEAYLRMVNENQNKE